MTELDTDFSMSPNTALTRYRCGVCLSTITLLSLLVVALCAMGWSPADWIQPSIVGLLWANIFMLGMASGKAERGSLLFACFAFSTLWLSKVALSKVTTLSDSECILIAAIIYGSSWIIALLDFRSPSSRLHAASHAKVSNFAVSNTAVRQYRQWTLWDLGTLTFVVALVCYGMPRIESPLILIGNVLFIVAGGLMTSWIAYRWAMDDNWSIYKIAGIVAWCLFSLWCLGRQSPTEYSLSQIASWMITGPLAVISMQGLVTLLFCAAVRLDQSAQQASAPKSAPEPKLDVVVGKMAEPALRIFSA